MVAEKSIVVREDRPTPWETKGFFMQLKNIKQVNSPIGKGKMTNFDESNLLQEVFNDDMLKKTKKTRWDKDLHEKITDEEEIDEFNGKKVL